MHINRTIVSILLLFALASCNDDRREERLNAAGPNPTLEALLAVADVDSGERKFRQCAACHKIGKGAPDFGGPNLYGIFGQRLGQHSARYSYTAALQNANGRWDASTLDAWMEDPQKVVPATKMIFAGVPDPLDRADLIAYIRSHSD
ncbi:cytochrome c family protein [Sphingomonas sp. C3-2]|uniref:c-type cytochrome n=1 Tax=Sphingomonas sp. C3-2 TaxID=3062169 RepID=UPI00294B04E3|nr:cytochrome c family protein [Sphingomonas sp. C3-2]WOK36686.1 cytochrome c family protein [Sphingomonas sp. C3-2]